jgi:hypothetical protein
MPAVCRFCHHAFQITPARVVNRSARICVVCFVGEVNRRADILQTTALAEGKVAPIKHLRMICYRQYIQELNISYPET